MGWNSKSTVDIRYIKHGEWFLDIRYNLVSWVHKLVLLELGDQILIYMLKGHGLIDGQGLMSFLNFSTLPFDSLPKYDSPIVTYVKTVNSLEYPLCSNSFG